MFHKGTMQIELPNFLFFSPFIHLFIFFRVVVEMARFFFFATYETQTQTPRHSCPQPAELQLRDVEMTTSIERIILSTEDTLDCQYFIESYIIQKVCSVKAFTEIQADLNFGYYRIW